MKVYEFDHPDYETDQQFCRKNPVHVNSKWFIPGIDCPRCTTWGKSDRIRLYNMSDVAREIFDEKNYHFLSIDEWRAKCPEWAKLLEIEESLITPAAELGPPRGKINCRYLKEDIVHPFPGMIWCKEPVIALLKDISATGIEYNKVDLEPSPRVKVVPQLWELTVSGKAWRKGVNEENIILCDICGRVGFPHPDIFEVDLSRWDGSDFFNVDKNPNIVLVTERIREAILDAGFSNVAFFEKCDV